MRLLRVRLRNFKGVEDREVRFERDGVTVLVGPNEAGKTSVADAIDLLFDFPDSSSHRAVVAARPVHRDEGAEVEAEVETGPYRFTYFKRFHKKRATELTVHAPRSESRTGRDAHDRVRAILEETVDLDLWRALRIRQGEALGLPDLDGRASLVAALDAAAGGDRAGGAEESLFERVEKRCLEFWGKNAKSERKVLTVAREATDRASGQVEELESELRAVESLVERHETLTRSLSALAAKLPDLEQGADERAAELVAVEARGAEVERLRAERETAERERDEAAARLEERRERVAVVEARERELAERERAEEEGRSVLERAEERLREAEATLAAAEERGRESAERRDRARAEQELRRAELDLDQLGDRLRRVREAKAGIVEAEERLADVRVDDEAVAALREAHLDLERARARAEPASASVELEALTDLVVDGAALGTGERRERRVEEDVTLEIERVARLRFRPGTSAAELLRARDEAEARLRRLLADAEVDTVEDASLVNERRKEAERRIEESRQVVKRELRDLTFERLEGKVASLVARVEAGREGPEPESADFDDAQERLREAEEAHAAVEETREAARTRRDEAAAARDAIREERSEAEADLRDLRVLLAEARSVLADAREKASDAQLEEVAASRTAAAEASAGRHAAAEEELAALDPDSVRLLAENAARARDEARAELRSRESERDELQVRLEERGAQGFAERLAEARARRHGAERTERSLRRRAEAARLLYETMRDRRDAARTRYARPLAERIVELGKLVFGSTFSVDLDDALRVESRTLHGVTVPFDLLSAGAREQVGVLARLAGAMIVAPEGGVPVILDDALGYSDPERIERLGAVLTHAGRTCQVVVLTCVGERYRHLTGARRVEIG